MMSSKKQPFCGVCYKAGKASNIYTTHWTRETPDPKSKITCPTILNTVCKYCKEKGHTVMYCEILNNKKTCRENNKECQFTKSEKREKETDSDGYVNIWPERTATWVSVAKGIKSVTPSSLVDPEDNRNINEPLVKQVKLARIEDWSECTDDEEYDYDYEYISSEDNRPCSPLEGPYQLK